MRMFHTCGPHCGRTIAWACGGAGGRDQRAVDALYGVLTRAGVGDPPGRCGCPVSSPSPTGTGPSCWGVPNLVVRDRVDSRFLPLIEETLAVMAGRPVRTRLQVVDRGASDLLEPDHLNSSLEPTRGDLRPVGPPQHGTGKGSPSSGQSRHREGGSGVSSGRPGPAVHLRDLRDRVLQPARPCGRPSRCRDPGPLLQPTVHLRRLGARKDPPPPRHRKLRPGETTRTGPFCT